MDFLTSEIIFYVFIAIIVILLAILIWNFRLASHIKKLTRGKNGSSLEEAFLSMDNDLDEFKRFRTELEKYLKKVEVRLSKGIRGVENINYNAFAGAESGGKSFAVALISEKGDGVILSSLHARDRVSVFSKKITNYESEIELSEEEKLALTKAKESCSL